MTKRIIALIIFSLLLTSCSPGKGELRKLGPESVQADPASTNASSAPSPTPTPALVQVSGGADVRHLSANPRSEPAVTPAADDWKTWPVIPAGVSRKMCQVYEMGQTLGNIPRSFSKVGDCQSTMPNYLMVFDTGNYRLGPYPELQAVIDYFSGSFGRGSMAVKIGMTASGELSPLWADWRDCSAKETPLDCEYRLHRPSFAIISLGTNDANGLVPFEGKLRKVIDDTLEHGVVPILATKADNAEGDNSINATIVRLASEYEIPLWNFWLAVQPLPDHGLRSPEHLTASPYYSPGNFSFSDTLQFAFNVRNLNALQVLAVMMNACADRPSSSIPLKP